MIYLMASNLTDERRFRFKIGISNKPWKRRKSMLTAVPDLKTCAYFGISPISRHLEKYECPKDLEVEAFLHKNVTLIEEVTWIGREWFTYDRCSKDIDDDLWCIYRWMKDAILYYYTSITNYIWATSECNRIDNGWSVDYYPLTEKYSVIYNAKNQSNIIVIKKNEEVL